MDMIAREEILLPPGQFGKPLLHQGPQATAALHQRQGFAQQIGPGHLGQGRQRVAGQAGQHQAVAVQHRGAEVARLGVGGAHAQVHLAAAHQRRDLVHRRVAQRQRHIRPLAAEARHHRRHQGGRQQGRCGHGQPGVAPLAPLAQAIEGGVELGKHRRHGGQQIAPGIGEGQAACGAFKQPHPQFAFQATDQHGQGRGREVQALCGAGDAAVLRHGGKGAQLAQRGGTRP